MRLPNCTVQRHEGVFCDAPSAEDMPFPICFRHAILVYRRLQGYVDQANSGPVVDAESIRQKRSDKTRRREVVYYVKIGELIKIGTTGDLVNRLAHYPPDAEFLVSENGGKDVEAERLREFEEYRTRRREWFVPGERLLDYIDYLRGLALERPAVPRL